MKKSIKMMLLLAMMLVAHTAKAQVVFSTFKLKPTSSTPPRRCTSGLHATERRR